MASQSSSGSGKRQKSLRWQRLERLNTPSPIIPLADDLDELTIEPPAAIEPPIAPVNLPELDAEIEVDAPDASSGVPESGESSELPTIADGSETPAESATPEAAVEPEAIDPVAPIALDDPDWDSEVIEFVPSTAGPVETETPSATATSPTGEAPDEIPSESPAAAIVPDPADPVVPDASEAVGDGEIDATTDGEPDPELLLQPTSLPEPEPLFQSGTFTVGDSGQVVIDVLWDGGAYRGQAGIFSLSGLDAYELGSTDFIAEVARRVTSDSVLGYVIWNDPTEAARFSGVMNGEANFNGGTYAGLKPFEMQAGDKFGVVLVPDTTFVKVLEQPGAEGSWRPLFSMVTANPHDSFQMGQIADVTGDGNTFTLEDLRVDQGGDKDYNDFVFQVRGATGEAVLMDEVVAPNKDWRNTDAGQLLVSYAEQYVEAPIKGGVSPSPDGFAGDDGLLPAPPADLPLDFEPSAGEALPNPADGVSPDAVSNLPGPLPTYTETRFEFPAENQPVIGIIDTGFAGNNPDFKFSNITWGKDYVSGDLDPTLAAGEGSQHGTHILGVIAAQQDNGVGIDGISPDAPIFATRAIGNGAWAEALTDTVDHIKASGQPNGVVNLSLDLTQRNPDGSITTRYELTPQERGAIEYARQNGVVLVVAASNDPGVMTVLDRAAQEFDNILTVGAAERVNNALAPATAYGATDYSGHGAALDLVADARHGSVSGLNVAVAKALGGVSQVWAANPELNHAQVIDILQRTSTDLGIPNWDSQTGAGLLNIVAATHLAKITASEPYTVQPGRWIITDQFISQNPANKPLPGDPAHPAAKLPGISATQVDTGSNSLGSATQIWMSPTADIIDQVSNIDPVDIFRVESRYFNGADLSVLDGELSIQYLSPSGQVLSTQVLGKGSHQLQLPSNVGNEVIVKLERRNQNPATYALYGFESAKSEPFNISLEFESPLTPNQQRILEAAAKNVASLIGQGLPTAVVDGKLIDDINIKISTQALDGTGGTQARTKIDFMRYGSLLPAQSLVQLDAADLSRLEQSGNLFDVAQHEFLHALGFGNLWEAKGLVDYAGTPLAAYNGKSAVAAFQNMGGLTDTVSLETDGNGSAGLHWHEGLFADEIMTADLNGLAGKAAPISAVTIASLADLGYVVNLNQATPNYQLATSSTIREVDLTPEQIEAFRALAEMSFDAAEDLGEDYESIAPIMPTVDSDTVAPEIWAHAERFWKNGEYYDWRRYQVQWGDTLSQIALDTMGSAHPDYYWWIANHNGIPNPDWIYKYDWIDIPVHHPNYEWEQEQERLRREEELRRQQEEEARRRREQEEAAARDQERVRQEEEARRREAEARQRELEEQERRLRAEQERRRQEEELRKERERLAELARQAEIARQQGKGGLDWYLAKPLSFGSADPFEIQMGDVVGNLVPDDYYRFTLSRGGRLTAELKQLLADADLVLYDVRNRPIAYSMREGITDEQIITDLIPGTYMLRVNSPKGVTTDYDLIVKFQHKLSMTQQGPPPGWRVGGSTGGAGSVGGGAGPIFSDPRIQQIYNTALNNFAAAERSKANAQIAQLEAEKRSYQQQLQALLDRMNAEQRAKVHQALDGARHEANVWVDNIANPLKGSVDNLADGIINQANSFANSLNGAADWLPTWPWDVRGEAKSKIRQAQDAVTGAVNGARSWLKGALGQIQNAVKSAVWHFFETIKNAYRTGAEINQIIANAANTFRSAIDGAVRGANDLVGQFKGHILSAVSWTRNLGIDAFGFKFNAYSQLVEPAVNSIAGGVSSAINGIGNSLKGITDWLEPRTQKVVADVVNALLGDQTGQLWNQINGVDAKIAATRTKLEQSIADAGRYILNVTENIAALLTNPEERRRVLDSLWQQGFKNINDAYEFVKKEVLKVRKEIEKEVEEASKKAKAIFANLVRSVLKNQLPTKGAIKLKNELGAEIDAIVAGGEVKPGTEYELSRDGDVYTVSSKSFLGFKASAGVGTPVGGGIGIVGIADQTIEMEVDPRIESSLTPSIGLLIKHEFTDSGESADDEMLKLGGWIFRELPTPIDLVTDPILSGALASNLKSIEVLGGIELSGEGDTLGKVLEGEIKGSLTPFIGRVRDSDDDQFNTQFKLEASGEAQVTLGLGAGLGVKTSVTVESRERLKKLALEIEGSVSGILASGLIPMFVADSSPVTDLIKNASLQIKSSGKAISAIRMKIEMTDTDLEQLGQQLGTLYNSLQDLTRPESVPEVTGDVLDTLSSGIELLRTLQSLISIEADVQQVYSLEVSGKIIVGGELKSELGFVGTQSIYSGKESKTP